MGNQRNDDGRWNSRNPVLTLTNLSGRCNSRPFSLENLWLELRVRAKKSPRQSVDASYLTHQECLYAVVNVATDSTTVSTTPAILYGIYVNTALSAHALPIVDSATTVVTIPASAAAGSIYTFPGIRFETSLIVDPNDAATGSITVAYRLI